MYQIVNETGGMQQNRNFIQTLSDSKPEDTWSGMPWSDFIEVATHQGFKVAYQKIVSDEAKAVEMEAILYRMDGLLLYITSFNSSLNKAVIEGEMECDSYHLLKKAKIKLNGCSYNGGSYAFSQDVQDGFVQFLEELKGIPIVRSWTENKRVLNFFNSSEEIFLLQDSAEVRLDKQRAIQIQKLSKCCKEARWIAAAALVKPREEDVRHFMLWDSFLKIVAARDFRIGYQNCFIDFDGSEQDEIIMYHTDGLLLYAYSECGCLTKVSIYGEVLLPTRKEWKQFSEWCEVVNGSNKVFTFTKDVCNGLDNVLQFLKGFELNSRWTADTRSLDLLNRVEWKSLEGSTSKDTQADGIARAKLLKCYAGAKQIMSAVVRHVTATPQSVLPAQKKPFHLLRKYSVQ